MVQQIATQLLRGSKALDRMNEEINQIIEILTGFLNSGGLIMETQEDGFSIDHNLHFPLHGLGVQWKVGRCCDSLKLYFELEKNTGCRGYTSVVYHSINKRTPMPKSVKFVRAALEHLAEALGERYPEMAKEWEPLLQAAEQ